MASEDPSAYVAVRRADVRALISLTDVAIVGGGPGGLMLAIELGFRGIDCVMFEQNTRPPQLPKANATSARTMEHYRRRGFAHEVRAIGMPPDYPQDIVYTTRLAEHELTRFHIPSAGQAAAQESFGDLQVERWPTPELPHRGQQMFVEPILKAQAEGYPSVSMRFGERVTAVRDDGDTVHLEAQDIESGAMTAIDARYAIGCDGPRSLVRQVMGTVYGGTRGAKRDFMGGNMLSLYFRSATLYDILNKPKAWQYWAVNPEQRCVMCAIDGIDTFVLLVQLKEDRTAGAVDPDEVIRKAVGATFPYELIAEVPWHAGYALVAEKFKTGRLLIAGDAAHLFTPTGGMGYNTSIDDVVNLGWKLAAVLQGWAPESLLDTYETERRPIALRNTTFAGRMADSIGGMPLSPLLEQTGEEAAAAREKLGEALAAHVRREFNIPGLQLGVRYESPIVATEDGPPPPDEPNEYVPSGYPGARSPHRPIGMGSLLDRFGSEFTLLLFAETSSEPWERAAARLRIPLTVVRSEDPRAHTLYGGDFVLVRPDGHIAWRGDASAEPTTILALATGATMTTAHA